MELTFEELSQAYFDCRKHKRNTMYALDFEFELEKNLYRLYEELAEGRYMIGRSIGFVVSQPKVREIWSATFRDRVVHHVIYNRLAPRFYPTFIRNSFACIPGRGSLDGSDHLLAGMRSITRNWSKRTYFLGADVRNFFVSIHKETLHSLLVPRIVEPWLAKLVHQVLFHDPRIDCFLKSEKEAFDRVPKHKSLWNTPADRGLPIGNLTSQFFANVYLNELDQFVKHELRARYYYRYVDDIVILGNDPGFLNACFDAIRDFLVAKLKLELHPFKKRLGLIHQGIDFVGFMHKPHRRYMRDRTLNKMGSVVDLWKQDPKRFQRDELIKFRGTMNSYLGLVKWGSTYNFRRELGEEISSLFAYPDEEFLKIIVPSHAAEPRRFKKKRKKAVPFYALSRDNEDNEFI